MRVVWSESTAWTSSRIGSCSCKVPLPSGLVAWMLWIMQLMWKLYACIGPTIADSRQLPNQARAARANPWVRRIERATKRTRSASALRMAPMKLQTAPVHRNLSSRKLLVGVKSVSA